jgi:hypothetical protein
MFDAYDQHIFSQAFIVNMLMRSYFVDENFSKCMFLGSGGLSLPGKRKTPATLQPSRGRTGMKALRLIQQENL